MLGNLSQRGMWQGILIQCLWQTRKPTNHPRIIQCLVHHWTDSLKRQNRNDNMWKCSILFTSEKCKFNLLQASVSEQSDILSSRMPACEKQACEGALVVTAVLFCHLIFYCIWKVVSGKTMLLEYLMISTWLTKSKVKIICFLPLVLLFGI